HLSEPYFWTRKKLKLLQRNVRLAKAAFVAEVRKIRENQVPKDQLLFYKETRRLEDYAVLPVHAYIVERGKLVPNKRVAYGIAEGPGRLLDKARAPAKFSDPDAEYYINKQLVPCLQRLFTLVGEDVRSWVPPVSDKRLLKNRGPLSKFIKSTCKMCKKPMLRGTGGSGGVEDRARGAALQNRRKEDPNEVVVLDDDSADEKDETRNEGRNRRSSSLSKRNQEVSSSSPILNFYSQSQKQVDHSVSTSAAPNSLCPKCLAAPNKLLERTQELRRELADIEDTTCATCVKAPYPASLLCQAYDCDVLGKRALLMQNIESLQS
ncbi:unnamed protein product, partial [Amoebophrya sp. A25]